MLFLGGPPYKETLQMGHKVSPFLPPLPPQPNYIGIKTITNITDHSHSNFVFLQGSPLLCTESIIFCKMAPCADVAPLFIECILCF